LSNHPKFFLRYAAVSLRRVFSYRQLLSRQYQFVFDFAYMLSLCLLLVDVPLQLMCNELISTLGLVHVVQSLFNLNSDLVLGFRSFGESLYMGAADLKLDLHPLALSVEAVKLIVQD